MKFFLTMNMPSNQGRSIHQIICEANNVKNLEDFWRYVSERDFIFVNEFYYEKDHNSDEQGIYVVRGPIVINTNFIGKIRPVPVN